MQNRLEKILVTGGTGFLGKALVRELLDQGYRVRCLARSRSSESALLASLAHDDAARARLELVPGSLDTVDNCRTLLQGCSGVVHAAAALSGAPAVLFLNTVVTTRMLATAACDVGVRRFVLVSSLAVYGTSGLRSGSVLDEDIPLDPKPELRDPYTFSKVHQELVCWEAHRERGLPLTVIRPGVIYGPGRTCLSNRCGLTFGSLMMQMGGRQRVPYTYVDNCARALVLALSAPDADGKAFNVIDDDLPRAGELVGQYRRRVRRLRVVRIPSWGVNRAAAVCEWIASRSGGLVPPVITVYKASSHWKRLDYTNSRAKAALQWAPHVSTKDGLERTISAEQRQVSAAV